MSDVPSTELTFDGARQPRQDADAVRQGEGHVADYGHCDLVWSRYAPREIFPPLIDWLDAASRGPPAPEPAAACPARRPAVGSDG